MRTEAKSLLILTATLSLGLLLGAVGAGTLRQQREAKLREIGRPRGFVEHMEQIIQPRDEPQRQALRPLLEQTARRNGEIIRGANDQMRAELNAMRERVSNLLDADQRARLDDFARLPPDPFRPPPPRDGRGQRGGPPRQR
jgi:hypothetical protein